MLTQTAMLNALTLALLSFSATLSMAGTNKKHFTPNQIYASLLLAACAGLIFALVALFFSALVLSTLPESSPFVPYVDRTLMVTFALLNMLILHERTATLLRTGPYKTLSAVLITGMLAVCIATSMSVLLVIVLLYCAFSLYDLNKHWHEATFHFFPDFIKIRNVFDNKKMMDSYKMDLKVSKNVYIFLLESFQPAETVAKTLHIAVEDIKNTWKSRNFSVQRNIFSNTYVTTTSLDTLLSMSYRYAVCPEVLAVLKNNAYEISIFSDSHFVPLLFSNYTDRANDVTNFKTFYVCGLFPVFFAQSILLRKLVCKHDVFNAHSREFPYERIFDVLEHSVDIATPKKKKCCIFHLGAMHRSLLIPDQYTEDPSFPLQYQAAYAKGKKEFEQLLDYILEHDPDSIVVAVGDHGARAFDTIHNTGGDDPNANMVAFHVDPALVAEDYFSVPLGIRGVPNDMVPETLSHVNVFRYIFAYMTGDASWASNVQKNMSLIDNFMAVEEGTPLTRWKPAPKLR